MSRHPIEPTSPTNDLPTSPSSPTVIKDLLPPQGKPPSTSTRKKPKFACHTCCGVIEMNSLKLACLIGLIVTSIAFLAIGVTSIVSFSTSMSKNAEVMLDYSTVTESFEIMNALLVKAVYSGKVATSDLALYENRKTLLQNTLLNIIRHVGGEGFAMSFNSTSIDASNKMIQMNAQLFLLVKFDQANEAVTRFESEIYTNTKEQYSAGLKVLLKYLEEEENYAYSNMLASNCVQLLVVGVSLVVVVPILVFLVMFAIRRDNNYLENLRKANAIMLMDTMADEKLRHLFKLHCEKELSLENFLLLEKIQEYRMWCRKATDLHEKICKQVVQDVSSSKSTSAASLKKNSTKYNNEYQERQAKKEKIARFIYSNFMLLSGPMAVNISNRQTNDVRTQLEGVKNTSLVALPDDLFDPLEREMLLTMLDTHHRFKQSLAFQRKMNLNVVV